MKKFKTNIKCEGCVSKVTPALNEVAGESNWQVDLQDPKRTLTVSNGADEESIIKALKKVGYNAERLS